MRHWPLHLKLGLRFLQSQKTYSLLNVLGLALGLAIFLLSRVLVQYEQQYDLMFEHRERIALIMSDFAPTSEEPIKTFPGIRTAYAPLLQQTLGPQFKLARTVNREQLLATKNRSMIHGVKFVDPAFFDLFNVHVTEGDLAQFSEGIVIADSLAQTLFGEARAVGQHIALEGKIRLPVVAVFEDLGPATHFNADFRPKHQLQALVPFALLEVLEDIGTEGVWTSPYAGTYVYLPEGTSTHDLVPVLNTLFDTHTPQDDRDYISGLSVVALNRVNQSVWQSLGFPLLEAVTVMGLLVLLLITVNYTNLATALAQLRLREVGLRRTFGANRSQLVAQFFSEHFLLCLMAGLLALAICENAIPLYNAMAGKNVQFEHVDVLAPLFAACAFVSACAAWFPVYLSSLSGVSSSLQKRLPGRPGSRIFSHALVVVQFGIAIFILAIMLVIYFQNAKLRQLAQPFLSTEAEMVTEIDRLPFERQIALRDAISALEEVEAASLSSDVPFYPGYKARDMVSGESARLNMTIVAVDTAFFQVHNLPLIAGTVEHPTDDSIAVVINRHAAKLLGYTSAQAAIGKPLSRVTNSRYPEPWHYRIVGVVEDKYFGGVHRTVGAQGFYLADTPVIRQLEDASTVKFVGLTFVAGKRQQGLQKIRNLWRSHAQGIPFVIVPIEHYLNLFFRIPKLIIKVLFGFALLSTVLALIGLFGLSAFVAQQRSHEMGIRKVMGASTWQIIRHLAWQFSIPVLVALLCAFPLAYFAADIYLNFFPERIASTVSVIALSGLLALLFAWLVIAMQAFKVAVSSPIETLRTLY